MIMFTALVNEPITVSLFCRFLFGDKKIRVVLKWLSNLLKCKRKWERERGSLDWLDDSFFPFGPSHITQQQSVKLKTVSERYTYKFVFEAAKTTVVFCWMTLFRFQGLIKCLMKWSDNQGFLLMMMLCERGRKRLFIINSTLTISHQWSHFIFALYSLVLNVWLKVLNGKPSFDSFITQKTAQEQGIALYNKAGVES